MTSAALSHAWNRIDSRFDSIAIGISGLCIVHCIATSLLLVVMASAGALLDPHIHEYGLAFAILFGVLALGKGIVSHGYMMPAAVGGFGLGMMTGALHVPHGEVETLFTMLGVFFLVLGHDLNRRATH
ncbi:MerC domain-containing protein [Stakelama sp. CBK3Z-3]|uniref:MerC domain-containing protein n=1 Tax=Stakelama flava TaxID=2860338 RepID=A0ABS6XKC7_9SPHN|nr:MerC domain-containing protein [Stakelama flava]MBW4329865.1 MerC domain-containing protein [Stakelama flava]